jgi:CRISP-associated protein Cas1
MAGRDPTVAPQPTAGERLRDLFSGRDDCDAVAVIDGHGVRLSVDRGQLRALDGVADAARQRSWCRASHGLARVAVIASSGDISIPALRWCRGAGVGLVVIDPFDGSVIATSAHTSNDDPRLRRAQAIALGTATGIEVVRFLLTRKLAGQERVAREIIGNEDAARSIAQIKDALADSPSISHLMQDEAVAAGIYFASWHGRCVPFMKRDQSRVEPGWLTFDGRHSAINPAQARNATDPLNAAISFGYRVLEANVRIACIAVGLDPGLGILHGDQKGRDSAVLDYIEPLRPLVDAAVLTFLERRHLRKVDLISDPRGAVRLRAPLTWEICSLVTALRDDIGRIIEQVADMLASSSPYDVSVPTVLTRSKHRQAARVQVADALYVPRAPVTGATNRKKPSRRVTPDKGPIRRCLDCGAVLRVEPGRVVARFSYCSECLPAHKAASARAAQRASVGRTGNAHDALATDRRRSANAEQRLAEQAFELAHDGLVFDREWYLREVLPSLASVSTVAIAKATGMSTSAASKIRAGKRVPHPRHWTSLLSISDRSAFRD